eukprot:Amastigsp_a676326_92.p5 type:complete len:121 gc:universal Amastigsp_a676326_92:426-64(-)
MTERVPPRSCALSVTTIAPTEMTAKTIAKTRADCALGALNESMLASVRQRSSGPQRSQSWSSARFEENGTTTLASLTPIRFRSRKIVTETGSSSELGIMVVPTGSCIMRAWSSVPALAII